MMAGKTAALMAATKGMRKAANLVFQKGNYMVAYWAAPMAAMKAD